MIVTKLQSGVSAHTSSRPDHPAVICGDSVLTYAELHRRGWMTAHALDASGLGPGSRVTYFARDSLTYYELLLGCAILGAVLVPIDPRLSASEVDHVLRDSGAELLSYDSSTVDILAELVDLPSLRETVPVAEAAFGAWRERSTAKISVPKNTWDTPVLQLYADGKGVVLAQRSFFAIAGLLGEHGLDWIGWWPDDRSLVVQRGFDIGGIWWAIQGLAAGVTNVIMPEFDGEHAVRLIREHHITITCLVPDVLRRLLDASGAADLRALRKIVYGGSPVTGDAGFPDQDGYLRLAW